MEVRAVWKALLAREAMPSPSPDIS